MKRTLKMAAAFASICILSTGICLAAEYPQFTGNMVNDFAEQLGADDHASLETQLRNYEKLTSIEFVFVTVQSMNGDPISDYANGLFKEWGIGKKAENNGVLLLWAPAERKVRIEVGYGLEPYLTDAASGEIIRDITAQFKDNKFSEGIHIGVDGVINHLGTRTVADRLAEQQRLKEERAAAQAKADAEFDAAVAAAMPWVAGFLLLAAIAIVIVVRINRKKEFARLEQSIPVKLGACAKMLENADSLFKVTKINLEHFKVDAPDEVYAPAEKQLDTFKTSLDKYRSDLKKDGDMPASTLAERRAKSLELNVWATCFGYFQTDLRQHGNADTRDFYQHQEHAQALLLSLPTQIETTRDRASEKAWPGKTRALFDAAEKTMVKANEAAAVQDRPNWLLVYDLVSDIEECLHRVWEELPSDSGRSSAPFNRHEGPRRENQRRSWDSSHDDSPAATAITALYPSTTYGSWSGSPSSPSSDDNSISLGGGGSGGGGAEGSY